VGVRLFGGTAIAAVLLLSLSSTLLAHAAPSSVGLAVSPARLDFKIPADVTELESSFQIANMGSDSVTVQITLSDLAIDKSGAWQLLPAASTPYSFPATFTPSSLTLAVGKTATIKVQAHLATSRPIFGGALLHPVAQHSSSSSAGSVGVQINPDLLVPLIAAPVGSNGIVEGVELSGKASGISTPMFVEHGPLSVTSSVVNTSQFYERVFTTITYSNFGHVFLTVDEAPVGTFPAGTARSSSTSIVQAPGAGALDVTPWFGIVEVTTTTHLTLLDSTAPPITQTAWVVVAPWRLLGVLWFVLVFGVALRWQLRRRRS
jgi:hypothetical protein